MSKIPLFQPALKAIVPMIFGAFGAFLALSYPALHAAMCSPFTGGL